MAETTAFFADVEGDDIFALGRYLQTYINQHWEMVFRQVQPTMAARFEELGDAVYGLYGTALFKPFHAQLKEAGWRVQPRLPGNIHVSREWGDDDTDRQRWMWSKITAPDGTVWGTLAIGFYHDHCEIRIPRPFRVIALKETAKRDVEKALAVHLPEFATALDMKAEYEQYLASLEG